MGARSKQPETSRSSEEKPARGWNPVILGALITAAATIMVAFISGLFGFPPFIAIFEEDPTLTPTSTERVLTPTFLVTDTLLPTDTPTLIAPPTPTNTVVMVVATDTPQMPIGMHPRLVADRTTGKAPLIVKLDARESFLRAQGGEIYGCRSGACEYTWEVYSGGQRIGKPVSNSTGTFQYTFGNKGIYVITVWVCRGGGSSDCNSSGAQIVVK